MNVLLDINTKPTQVRVKAGRSVEDHVFRVLTERYGLPFSKGTSLEDMRDKIDWKYPLAGKDWPCAFKGRAKMSDILVAIRDPWGCRFDPENNVGRDMLRKYLYYITLSPDQKVIRMANGFRVHKICEEMWQELRDIDYDIGPRKPLRSKLHPGCELRYTVDGWKGHPKVLGFVPPGYLKTDKEIWYYENVLLEE